MNNFSNPYLNHLQSATDLKTSHQATRAGFVSMALEKNRRATPFIDEARKLKALAAKAESARDLVTMIEIREGLVAAAGVSDKAGNHLGDEGKLEAIKGLVDNFLEPAGSDFVEELVYRFLLTRGDTLGGAMRNVVGALAERKLTRSLISCLNLAGYSYYWLGKRSQNGWVEGGTSVQDADIELIVRGLSWNNSHGSRTLIYNLNVPIVKNNIDLCLFNSSYKHFSNEILSQPQSYLALGELKGGIDPAGADEHWKTARTALNRIHLGFNNHKPPTFYIGAAIEARMANEIWKLLETDVISNAANLTDENQLTSISTWLCNL